MKKIPMTPDGYKTLMERLKYLRQVERPKNVADIESARDKGDLSENAEYDAAKDRQNQIDQQIKELEHKLSLAQVIDPKGISSEKIVFGATVTLADIDNDEHLTYSIVGTDESDVASGKISVESPIARALIGKEAGDEIKVTTPKGIRNFEVINIDFK